ncbi:MAG: hypothetical protein FWE09_10215, partial [Treponema sp.]|nr:hypothetical protein [Treponema sp.]
MSFDFRTDCNYPEEDPDSCSKELKNSHKHLWSKKLPNNLVLKLEIGTSLYDYLHWNDMRFGSDTMSSTYCHTAYKEIINLLPLIPNATLEKFRDIIYTIGNFIIFPKGNGNSINQDRGSYFSCIKDRFDLTLECIRLYYEKKENPLNSTLKRYCDFFDLFGNFDNYIKFFLLQDFIDKNG